MGHVCRMMNQEQRKKQKGFVDLRSGDDNAFTRIKSEGGEQFPRNNCMDVVFEKVINYLEFVKILASELQEHDALSLQTKK